ncbi:protein zer-1 homolog [Arctopsyche grandis]|uniref:protein zer-1 homolog n=1 Tax=Arctopsyche grandis TaxID=121162 RepID=UPI00406D82B5
MDESRLSGFTPHTLFELCVDVACLNWPLPLHAPLPAEVCDRLLEAYQSTRELTDSALQFFADRNRTRLQAVRLRTTQRITSAGFRILLDHQLEELSIDDGRYIPRVNIDHSHYFVNMTALRIVGRFPIFIRTAAPHFVPKLNKLSLIGHMSDLCTLESLTHLEVADCQLHLQPIERLKNLTSLILYNVWWVEDNINLICSLTKLQHLDVSQHKESFGHFSHPNEKLTSLVESLLHLKSLDISGTNLAGTGGAAACDKRDSVQCDIPGLASRVNNPLNFLGLYGTAHAACCRHDIPAIKISGDANEEQILTAATLYMGRPEILTRVLNDLYHLFRNGQNDPKKQWTTLRIILKAMDMHVQEKHIQICGSATLFYIVKGKKNDLIGIKLRRHIITTLLQALETHLEDPTMMRNGCLTLCQFKIPADVVFEYKRVVNILLTGVSNNQEVFVQRVAIYLLNSFACQVDAIQKRFLGDHGVIVIMLALITDRLKRNHFDDVLEVAWSTMWNVTDETPVNCQRFLDNDGLQLFIGCLKSFPDKEELLRNMMGLLGNVAEVKHLRPVFMSDLLITEFVELLDSQSDGIEVSYNAAGVLAHLASDGEDAWTIKTPTRKDVLAKMLDAIRKWNLSSRRNINYRSFEPLVGLLKAYHTPECQHWAIWALANLTTVYPEKYCSLVVAERGVELLNDILKCPTPYQHIKTLAGCVLRNIAFQDTKDGAK